MACCHLLSFLLSILLFIFISPSLSFPVDDDVPVKSQKVKLSLYYESLCPYCANFIENRLVNFFNTDLTTVVDLRLVSYGNAQAIGPDKTIICLYSGNECYLNTIHTCDIKAWPDVLILKYANETPPHSFVPWVTVNDQALAEEFQNFIAFVCQAYKGENLPKASSLRWHRSTVKETSILPFYYEDAAR